MTDEHMNDDQNFDDSEPNYDIPAVLMTYVEAILPDADEMEDDTDAEEQANLISRAFFICSTAWNYAALPEDCAAKYITEVEQAVTEAFSLDSFKEAHEAIVAMAADMARDYPDTTHLIASHDLEEDEDGEIALSVEVVPIEEAIDALREDE